MQRMSLTLPQLQAIAGEWQTTLVGARIHRVRQRDRSTLLFQLKGNDRPECLLLSIDRNFGRGHTCPEWPNVTKWHSSPAADFCKAHLEGQLILGVEVEEGDRIVRLTVGRKEPGYVVHFELIGRWANVILSSAAGVIQEALRHFDEGERIVQSGEAYVLPPTQAGDAPEETEGPEENETWNDWAFRTFTEREAEAATEELRDRIDRELTRLEKHQKGIRVKVERSQAESADPDRFKQLGDILQANVGTVPVGAESVTLPDLYGEEGSTVEIPLDRKKSPQENIDGYYKKFKKAKRTLDATAERLEKLRQEEQQVAAWRARFDSIANEDLEAFAEDLFGRRPVKKKKVQPRGKSGPRRFFSRDGWLILVGRSDRENDELSIKIANGRDWWFHSDGSPGSHVVARVPGKDAAIPQETLLDAATLALFYSPRKNAPAGDVAYTQAKHVSKPRGAKPGLVRLSDRKVIRVRMEEDRIQRLMDSRPGMLEESS
jgi:predicted ribosome quality control (RQC) complex YloA/Tae2 family protein